MRRTDHRAVQRALQPSAAGAERPKKAAGALQPSAPGAESRRRAVRMLQPVAPGAESCKTAVRPSALGAESCKTAVRALQPSASRAGRPEPAGRGLQRLIAVLVCLLCASSVAGQAKPVDLRTLAEQTKFVRTGRYAEVEQLCAAFARAYPKQLRCFEFGRTPEGRPMLALAASADGKLDPAAVK
ncbi:MAG TPA: hypothetical protein VMF89_33220, partial [Polyangiales bacterium]|nr:hypothetical protein [Polyangiales bacterium]